MASASSPYDNDPTMASDNNNGKVNEFADGLRGLGQDQQRMLDVIDNLRSAALENVKLPQLVVVGDQSSGKSSVLEAISGIPISKDSDACTRFATEFRLRRGADGISVGIIPSDRRTDKDKKRLLDVEYRTTDAAQLGRFLKECERAIFTGDEPERQKFASRDIVTIEICGPTMPMLTLVDLPGFINMPNQQQTAEDIAAIKDIALEYMRKPHTIVLAIVPATSDYVTHTGLKNALDCDKGGVRTLGIITKPDLIRDLEDKFIRLARNEDIKLDLGWHVLRNRGSEETGLQAHARNQIEREFFTQGKWRALPPGTYGVESLVAKLSVLLYNHITEYFPQLLKEIKAELKRSENELLNLGRRLNTESERMYEVATLFSRSHSLIKSAVDGNYQDHPSFFHPGHFDRSTQNSPRHLRSRINRENGDFEKEIRTRGCQVRLLGVEGLSDKGDEYPEDDQPADPISRMKMEDYETQTVQRYIDIYAGRQLPGDHDPSIVYPLFASYSAKWDDIARRYRDKVQSMAKECLQQVVNSEWPQRMRTPLWSVLLNKQLELRQMRAEEEIERLLSERQKYSPIYGPDYPRRLKELQDKSAPGNMSPARGILQKMLVYYELTSRIFVSNVIVQVAERHLIDGLHTIFDTVELTQMDTDTLEKIADEDELSRTRRDRLEQKVTGLRRAQKECLAIALAKGQLMDQQSEPEVVNKGKKEDVDQPPQSQHLKLARADTSRRHSSPSVAPRRTRKGVVMPYRRRSKDTVQQTTSQDEVSQAGFRPVLMESGVGKKNGVLNGSRPKKSNNEATNIRDTMMRMLSGDEEEDDGLAF